MTFLFGFVCGASVTLFLVYRKLKNKKSNDRKNNSFRSELNKSQEEDF